ncbi:MAG: hypothetical protein AAGJ82_10275, partial [Bacteroidota bacterium]
HQLSVEEVAPQLPQVKQLVVGFRSSAHSAAANLIPFLRKGDLPITQLTENTTQQGGPAATQIIQVDGRYNEDKATNEAEAREVLQHLNTIERTPQQTYPRVGIVTLTRGQRDLLLGMLYRIKRERSPGADLIQQLERNGLQILTVADVAGQSFDQLLLSLTYGAVDREGRLTERLNQLRTVALRSALADLRQLAVEQQQLYCFSSVSAEEWAEQIAPNDEGSWGQFVTQLYQQAMEATSALPLTTVTEKEASVLARELTTRLNAALPNWTWESADDETHAPLLRAATPAGKSIVLLLDGYFSTERFTAHDWEWEQQERLRTQGTTVVNIDSVMLWKQPQRTVRELVQRLEVIEEEE